LTAGGRQANPKPKTHLRTNLKENLRTNLTTTRPATAVVDPARRVAAN
jgi:hypothetical protein